jgi:hypothetical protein
MWPVDGLSICAVNAAQSTECSPTTSRSIFLRLYLLQLYLLQLYLLAMKAK